MFKRVYIEESCLNDLNTKKILEKLKINNYIIINDYKEIFNRKNQNFLKQKNDPNLVIAKKKRNFLYPLSRFCEDYDYENIYYASTILNCVFKCEYCFLSGMYNSGNIVVFINLEDLDKEIKEINNKNNKTYLCVSYDSDILALDSYFNFFDYWYKIAYENKDMMIEIRTKAVFKTDKVSLDNLIICYTLTPNEIQSEYEGNTPKLKNRLISINALLDKGYKVQLAFEPLIYSKNYEEIYRNMLLEIEENIDLFKIDKFSLGCFRISKDYYQNMLKNNPTSKILNYPFLNCNNMILYNIEKENLLINVIYDYLLAVGIDRKKIYIWK